MIDIHVYGFLKKQIGHRSNFGGNVQLKLPHLQDERFIDLVKRLGVSESDLGDCFVNHEYVVDLHDHPVPPDARVALFSKGMALIDLQAYKKYRIHEK